MRFRSSRENLGLGLGGEGAEEEACSSGGRGVSGGRRWWGAAAFPAANEGEAHLNARRHSVSSPGGRGHPVGGAGAGAREGGAMQAIARAAKGHAVQRLLPFQT